MTLVALHVADDFAEILTDTLTVGATRKYAASKIIVHPHMDLAITGRGPCDISGWWGGQPSIAPDVADDLDQLDQLAPQHLRWAWDQQPATAQGRTGQCADAEVMHVGWSPSAGRFTASLFRQSTGFEREPLPPGLHCWPAPAAVHAVPADAQDWIDLADDVYRAQQPGDEDGKTPIGDRLILTRLERGAASQRVVHTFPHDAHWRRLFIGTLQREGQLGPCACGSGQPFLACHLPPFPPSFPCPCGGGDTFWRCCRVDPDDPASDAYWRQHVDDFHDTQDALTATWQRTAADLGVRHPPQIIPPRPGAPAAGHQSTSSRRERRTAARSARRPHS